MKYLLIAYLCFTFMDIKACVTVNPQNKTYTVDPSGCFKD